MVCTGIGAFHDPGGGMLYMPCALARSHGFTTPCARSHGSTVATLWKWVPTISPFQTCRPPEYVEYPDLLITPPSLDIVTYCPFKSARHDGTQGWVKFQIAKSPELGEKGCRKLRTSEHRRHRILLHYLEQDSSPCLHTPSTPLLGLSAAHGHGCPEHDLATVNHYLRTCQVNRRR